MSGHTAHFPEAAAHKKAVEGAAMKVELAKEAARKEAEKEAEEKAKKEEEKAEKKAKKAERWVVSKHTN
jgi:hypothetical protein